VGGLPADIQKIFTTLAVNGCPGTGGRDQADGTDASLSGLQREMIMLAPEEQQKWKQAVEPVLAAYVSAAKEKGLPGEQFLKDAQDLMARYSRRAISTGDAVDNSQPSGQVTSQAKAAADNERVSLPQWEMVFDLAIEVPRHISQTR
jgi:hypothetical protein